MAGKGATCISTRRGARGGVGVTELGGKEPTYTYIDDWIVAVRWPGDVEDLGVLPDSCEDYNWVDDEDKVFDIMTEDFIQ